MIIVNLLLMSGCESSERRANKAINVYSESIDSISIEYKKILIDMAEKEYQRKLNDNEKKELDKFYEPIREKFEKNKLEAIAKIKLSGNGDAKIIETLRQIDQELLLDSRTAENIKAKIAFDGYNRLLGKPTFEGDAALLMLELKSKKLIQAKDKILIIVSQK